jgi:hypothetical protein
VVGAPSLQRSDATDVDALSRAGVYRTLVRLAVVGALLLAATLSGEILLAVAENGNASFETLVLYVALPAFGLLVILTVAAARLGYRTVVRGVLLGAAAGAIGTAALELVRNVGFYEFQSMPGQLPELMGVLMTNRIMEGPDLVSNLLGWTDHVWNGATLGITYALVFAGAPRGRSSWRGAGLGAVFGAVVGTGFLLSPVSRATGAGIFGSLFGMKYVYTVYLAHLAFGAVLGVLVHRFGSRLEPLWETVGALVARRATVGGPAHSDRPASLEQVAERSGSR